MLSSFNQKSSVQMKLMALVNIPFPVPSFKGSHKKNGLFTVRQVPLGLLQKRKAKALLITIICSEPPSPQVWAKLIFARWWAK